MPELISNAVGYTIDPEIAVVNTSTGVARSVGDVVQLRHKSLVAGQGLNFAEAAQTTGSEGASKFYGVIMEASPSNAITLKVLLRGNTKVLLEEVTAVSLTSPLLIASVHGSGGATNAVTSAVDAIAAAAGDGSVKVIAAFISSTTPPATGDLIDVMFDGINGFGNAEAATI